MTRSLVPLALFVVFRAAPAVAALGGAHFPNPLVAPLDPASFLSALTASFALVLASEIGDKTFFISALLSMKHSRLLVFLGTLLALTAMTVISVLIGQLFHALPPSLNTSIPFDDYAAVALLLWFGFQSIRSALSMSSGDDEELQDAKDVVAGRAGIGGGGLKIVAQTTSLIFLAEWGDKSMLATVALAAAKSPWGVIVGGISGHFVATVIAVVGGSFLGNFLSERNARLIGEL
ncbi:Gdt1 [Gracilaria domingensis]|nr:Gdt1 [Gracilaria domingensis]